MKTTSLFSFMIVYLIINGTVIGTVTDIKTKEEITGARVIVNKTDTVYTDFNGQFIDSKVNEIKTLDVYYPSYDSLKIDLLAIK
jgi:sporulation protein YlmC with PRC-barrel domain